MKRLKNRLTSLSTVAILMVGSSTLAQFKVDDSPGAPEKYQKAHENCRQALLDQGIPTLSNAVNVEKLTQDIAKKDKLTWGRIRDADVKMFSENGFHVLMEIAKEEDKSLQDLLFDLSLISRAFYDQLSPYKETLYSDLINLLSYEEYLLSLEKQYRRGRPVLMKTFAFPLRLVYSMLLDSFHRVSYLLTRLHLESPFGYSNYGSKKSVRQFYDFLIKDLQPVLRSREEQLAEEATLAKSGLDEEELSPKYSDTLQRIDNLLKNKDLPESFRHRLPVYQQLLQSPTEDVVVSHIQHELDLIEISLLYSYGEANQDGQVDHLRLFIKGQSNLSAGTYAIQTASGSYQVEITERLLKEGQKDSIQMKSLLSALYRGIVGSDDKRGIVKFGDGVIGVKTYTKHGHLRILGCIDGGFIVLKRWATIGAAVPSDLCKPL